MITAKAVEQALDALATLQFFPHEEGARKEIAKLIGRMCTNDDQVLWLGRRSVDLLSKWQGPAVLRQIFCSKFKPADGIDMTCTEAFPGGIPSENPAWRPSNDLDAINAIPLLPGHIASNDSETETAVVRVISAAKSLPQPSREDYQAVRELHSKELPNPPPAAPGPRYVEDLRTHAEKIELARKTLRLALQLKDLSVAHRQIELYPELAREFPEVP